MRSGVTWGYIPVWRYAGLSDAHRVYLALHRRGCGSGGRGSHYKVLHASLKPSPSIFSLNLRLSPPLSGRLSVTSCCKNSCSFGPALRLSDGFQISSWMAAQGGSSQRGEYSNRLAAFTREAVVQTGRGQRPVIAVPATRAKVPNDSMSAYILVKGALQDVRRLHCQTFHWTKCRGGQTKPRRSLKRMLLDWENRYAGGGQIGRRKPKIGRSRKFLVPEMKNANR
jgi:hypothetical protein